jgi:CheY-like chemotaxis protein
MLVTELLSSLGYNVMEAADGISGLQLLQSDLRIDVLVSDIGLPGGMNGREMAGIARKSRPGLPVLFITGYAESAVIEKAHLEPRTQVLTKPFVLDALSARVATLVKLSNIRSTRQ